MGFRQADSQGRGGFARVWSVEDKGNYAVCKVSTSKKRKDGDGYETDFQDGFVRFIGSAYSKVLALNPGEKGASIQITSCDVNVTYNAETKKTYTNYAVFAFDVPEGNGQSTAKTTAPANKRKAAQMAELEDDSNELPF